MSNYSVDILKAMIASGVREKPVDCEEELWKEANTHDAEYSTAMTVAAPIAEVVPTAEVYPQSYGFGEFQAAALPINVDAMMKYSGGSFLINNEEVMKVPFKATFKIGESKFKRTICVSENGKTKYYNTYGGGVDTTGQPWTMVLNRCQAIDSKAYDFPSCDMVLVLDEDIKGIDGKVIGKKGMRIGHTTPSSEKKNLAALSQSCAERGIDTAHGELPVLVSFEAKKNDGNQRWTVLSFKAI